MVKMYLHNEEKRDEPREGEREKLVVTEYLVYSGITKISLKARVD